MKFKKKEQIILLLNKMKKNNFDETLKFKKKRSKHRRFKALYGETIR